jgi:hypothetical protein
MKLILNYRFYEKASPDSKGFFIDCSRPVELIVELCKKRK